MKASKLLDGLLILQTCKASLPHEPTSISLPAQGLNGVAAGDLTYFKNVTSVDLSDNQVALEDLSALEQVKEITLTYNQLREIGIRPGMFRKVTRLNLGFNNLRTEELRKLEFLPRLVQVNVEANRLTKLPESLAQLTKLRELNLAGNQLTEECLDSLATIPNLQSLNLARNRLSSWRTEKSLPQLRELVLSNNQVQAESSLISAIQLNQSLTVLDISGNPCCETQECHALSFLISKRHLGMLLCHSSTRN